MSRDETAELPARVRRDAARWVTRRAFETANDEAAFSAWLASDRRHAGAYRAAKRAWSDLAAMGEISQYRALLGAPTWRERLVALIGKGGRGVARPAWRLRLVAAPAALLLLGLVVALSSIAPSAVGPKATLMTRIAEIREIPLPDGSVVTLGAHSRIALAFSGDERRLRLEEGEAFFSVAKDPERPFIVQVGDTLVRAVGTEFDVHKGPQAVRVAVVEGVVEIAPSRSRTSQEVPRRLVSAGEAIVAPRDAPLRRLATLPAERAGEWRRGRLVYNGAPLLEVVADANRYSPQPIRIADAGLADLRVTTSFRADQIKQMLETLSLALPLRIAHQPDGTLLLVPRTRENVQVGD